MAGGDAARRGDRGRAGERRRDYAACLDAGALRGARIGVARAIFTGFDERRRADRGRRSSTCRRLGAEIVDPVDLAPPSDSTTPSCAVLLYELKADLPQLPRDLRRRARRCKTLADVIAFNRAHRDREMPWFGQELFEQAEANGALDRQGLPGRARRRAGGCARDDGIDAVMTAHRLDALVAPTGGPAWLIDPVNGDHFVGGSSSPAAVAGYPHLTVPAGLVRGLPIGLSFFGRGVERGALLGARPTPTSRRRH